MIHAHIILLFVRLLICLLYLWRLEGNFGDLVVSFHHVAPRDWNSGRVDWLPVPFFTHWATSPAPDV